MCVTLALKLQRRKFTDKFSRISPCQIEDPEAIKIVPFFFFASEIKLKIWGTFVAHNKFSEACSSLVGGIIKFISKRRPW